MSETRRLYVSVTEAAEILRVPEDTVRWRLRAGKLRGRKTKRGWRVVASELQAKERP